MIEKNIKYKVNGYSFDSFEEAKDFENKHEFCWCDFDESWAALSKEDLQELTDEDLEYDLKEIDNVRKVYLSEIKKRKTKK